MPAWLQGILAIAPPVALAGTSLVSSLLLRLVDRDDLLLVLDNNRWRLARDVVRVVQVTKPNLGRKILRLQDYFLGANRFLSKERDVLTVRATSMLERYKIDLAKYPATWRALLACAVRVLVYLGRTNKP